MLRGLDRSGTAAQLRTQLRLAHDAAAAVGQDPVGCVVGGDLIFEQQRPTLLQTAVLLREVNEAIAAEDDGTPNGKLRARICALLFLIKEVDATVGLRATADTLADLLVTDLPAGSANLRQRIPELLKNLVGRAVIMQVGDEYQVQTREGAEWDKDYRSRNAAIKDDDARISREREGILRGAVEGVLKGLTLTQGDSRTARQYDLHFGSDAPVVEAKVPVWVRSGWDITENAVKREAEQAGADSPIVFVYLPRQEADDLKPQIAGYLAADEVLQTRPAPTTDEGRAARSSVQAHKDTHNSAIQTLVSNVLDNARVFQGGGTEVQSMDLRSTLERASEASLLRLYRRFPEADLSTWNRVSERARQGDPDALAHIGYSGDPSQHLVCREILGFIGPSGKTGNDIRKQFEAPPYGWPRDAIDASLIVLTASGHLRATYKSQPASAPDLTGTTLQQTEFRAERRVITTAERLAIRRLLTDTGVAHKPGGEATAVRDLLEQMTNLAEAAGGPPPLPAKAPADYIDDLKSQTGNELLAAVYEQREQLLRDYTDWTEARQKIGERSPRWDRLRKLLEHAKALPVYDEIAAEAQAILDGRKLLAEPDTVPPLVSGVCDALRKAARDARDRHLQAYDDKINDLLESDTWKRLPQDKQDEIRKRRGLVALPPLNVETEDDLLRALDETPLPAWEDKTAAMAERVTEALLDAARELEPKARRVVLRSTTIHNEPELDQYLADVRRQALDVIKEGNPVVLP